MVPSVGTFLLLPSFLVVERATSFVSPSTRHSLVSQTCLNLDLQTQNSLFPTTVYDTILSGRIAVLPNYLPPEEVLALRTDAQDLHAHHHFSTDALASYGSSGTFDPSRDRAVLRLNQWQDSSIGNDSVRRRFERRMADIRSDLAYHLDRPHLNQGLATTRYGRGSTEISYTRFGPGAFLKRHVDEHHEELKGRAGWSQPTRRSVSWLIYLNNQHWNAPRDGGQLRTFERSTAPSSRTVGARPNGDLQIGWLGASAVDPLERPVFLDGRQEDAAKCAMYIVQQQGGVEYITPTFDANPILYMAGGETLVRKTLMSNRRDLAERFRFIEPPKSKIGDLLASNGDKTYAGTGLEANAGEVIDDVEPIGGTLVLFDSVTLPHEVLATKDKERWATSGWFHEDQQAAEGLRSIDV